MAGRTRAEAKRAEYQARKQERLRRRREEKEQWEADREMRELRRQKVLRFDADGNRIGDDGYVMTRARSRLHQLCNGYFFLMCGAFLVAVACVMLSFFQGQQLTEWELVAYGGNEFRGMSVATMLRIEALFLLFLTATALLANMKGMAWLYDGAPFATVRKVMVISGVVSVAYFVVMLALVQVPEPFSLVAACMAALMHRFTDGVAHERGSLTRPAVARTVVKGR